MWGGEKWLSVSLIEPIPQSSSSDLRQYNGQDVLATYYATASNKFKEIMNSNHTFLTIF
jgi:hypothetical protein